MLHKPDPVNSSLDVGFELVVRGTRVSMPASKIIKSSLYNNEDAMELVRVSIRLQDDYRCLASCFTTIATEYKKARAENEFLLKQINDRLNTES